MDLAGMRQEMAEEEPVTEEMLHAARMEHILNF